MFSVFIVFFFKQKTAYEMRISDWSSDVCSSDLSDARTGQHVITQFDIAVPLATLEGCRDRAIKHGQIAGDVEVGKAIDELCTGLDRSKDMLPVDAERVGLGFRRFWGAASGNVVRSEEHTSELQSLMRISYAVFCLKKKNTIRQIHE